MVCKSNKLAKGIIFLILFFTVFDSLSIKAFETNENEEALEVNQSSNNKKVAYLTFDDGPSINNTPRILNILNENEVKATFFIIGKNAEKNKDILTRMAKDGMCIYSHSYSHDYGKIYQSLEAYMKDLQACNEAIETITGIKNHEFIRFPGGSDNRVSNPLVLKNIKENLKSQGVRYIDWNISSADASANSLPAQKIKDNVIRQSNNWDTAVILMHDAEGKDTTVEALPDVIRYLKARGYEFKTLDNISQEEIDKMIKYGVINR